MALPTGTVSNAGTEFHFPSGTIVYAAKIIGFPEIAMGERDSTSHGSLSAGVIQGQREPNNRVDASDFTIGLLEVTGHSALYTDMKAGTQRVCLLKSKTRQFTFTGWIKSIKQEDANVDSPDSVKATVVVTPVGEITIGNV
jgi:hypothetical protein